MISTNILCVDSYRVKLCNFGHQILGRRFGTNKMHSSPHPRWLKAVSVLRRWFCCCWSIVKRTSHCLWEFCVCLCFVMHVHCVHSSFAIILKRERNLVGCFPIIVLHMYCYCAGSVESSWCHGLVWSVWLWFPDHTHLLFQTAGKFGQRPSLFHIIIIGIEI